jgi:DinB superfamily
MSSLQATIQKLNRAQQRLLKAADGISSSEWNTPPDRNSWSAAHLVVHLCQVERGVLGYADRVIRKAPRRVPLIKRFHFPVTMVESRRIKRKTPLPLDLALLGEKETMLSDLRSVREKTLSFLEETHGRDLSVYYWPHPFLGQLNFYNWFAFVASHQIRHTQQLVEISKNLPNHVVSSQN